MDTSPFPKILHLPGGGMVLCEHCKEDIRITCTRTGRNLSLSGSLASRMGDYLSRPADTPFPSLGPVVRQHPWLLELKAARSSVGSADLLLGNGLGMLFIELTDRCNERCLHCYAESSPDCSARLSREDIRQVLEQARTLGKPAVQFTGGDPLLHPDLLFAVQTARALGYTTIEIYTNGLALNQALLKQLEPLHPAFALSVYAHDAAVHDRITQTPGSLERTLKAIHRIQDMGLPLRIGVIVMAENHGMEKTTISFLEREAGLDAGQIGVDIVRSTGRGIFQQDAPPANRTFKHFTHRSKNPEIINNPDQPAETQEKPNPRRGKLCISASGDVFPCIFSRRVRLGNIRQQPLPEIIRLLDTRKQPMPSQKRWQQCREQLSCSDCQGVAYLLGNADGMESGKQGEVRVVT